MKTDIYSLPLDLRMFDLAVQTPSNALNANTSGDTNLSAGMVTFYDKTLITFMEADLVYERFAEKKPIPKKSGKTIQFRYYDSLGKATTPLTEGVTPSGQKLKQNAITATLYQYGAYVTLTDVLDLVHIDSNITEAQKECARQAAETRDTLIREELMGGGSVQYADGSVTSRAALTAAKTMSVDAIRMAVRTLKRNNAPKIDGYYVAIIHPDVAHDIESDSNWKTPHEYTDTQNIYNGEIGSLYGVRFVETTEAKIWAKAAASNTIAVYGSIFLGKGAYAVTDIDGGIHSIIKQLGSAGSADPLDQRSTVGWKMMMAVKRLIEKYMVRVETVSSYGDAAAN